MAMLSMTALIATGIATQHGPSPENQATMLTATLTELPPEPVTPKTDTQHSLAADEPIHPIKPAADAAAPRHKKDQPTDREEASRPGLPLTPFERPMTAIPGRKIAPNPRQQSEPGPQPSTQIAVPPIDLTGLLTNITAALNAGAAFAQGLGTGSATLDTGATTPAAPTSTESDTADDTATTESTPATQSTPTTESTPATQSTPTTKTQPAAPASDLASLLANVTNALKVGAALTQGLESGSSLLGTGSAVLGSGSSLLEPGSAALGSGSSIAGAGSSVLAPVLVPLSAAALASA
ncbi:hypothetical protein [Nocardia altamirensis]|uniref:hypothetical protein n=1 Tax=Nocardia altamirensis TaxID=472158 RepID=UPI00114CED17|nr:hypothetical protein [Nocardia altamirensis]